VAGGGAVTGPSSRAARAPRRCAGSRPRPWALACIAACVLALASAGCGPVIGIGLIGAAVAGGGGGGGGGGDEAALGSVTVGPDGANFAIPGGQAGRGSTVDIPAGALSAPVDVTFGYVPSIPAAGSLAVGPALRMGPAGTTFALPVTIDLQFSPGSLPSTREPGDVVVLHRDDATGATVVVRPVAINASTALVTFRTTSFSTFQVHVGVAPDPAGSSIAIDRSSGVTADGVDAATALVTVRDIYGMALPGVAVVLEATGAGNTISGPSGATDASGEARGTIRSTRAETKGVAARLSTPGGLVTVPGQVTVTFVPGPAAALSFATGPSEASAGAVIAPAVEVAVADAHGNRLQGAGPVVTVALAAAGGASLTGTLSVAAAGGLARFGDLRVGKAGAGYRIVASTAGAGDATSGPFTVRPGAAAGLAFTEEPTDVTAGAAFATTVAVAVRDTFGNVVTTSAAPITLEVQSGPAGASLTAAGPSAASAGIATFPSLRIHKAGAYALRAVSPALASGTSAAFEVRPGALARIAFVDEPSSVEVRSTLAPVRVGLEDAFGNRTPGTGAPVTLSLTVVSPSAGVLTGTLSQAPAAGLAAFTDLSIDRVGTGYRLHASLPGQATVTSRAFDVVPAPADKLAFVVGPSSVTAGAAIAPAVQVAFVDRFGGVSASTAQVTLTLVTNPGGATLSGGGAAAAVGGVATFASVSLDRTGTGYVLRASASGVSQVASAPFDVRPGPPAALAFTTQPSAVPIAAPITPPVRVAVRDALGNLVTGAAPPVEIALGPNPPAPATLSGTLSRAPSAGVAEFGDLALDATGTAFTLRASMPGSAAAPVVSAPFEVGPPLRLVIRGAPRRGSVNAYLAPPVEVVVERAQGGAVTNAALPITLSIDANPGGGALSGATARVASAGLARFDDLSIDAAAGGYRLRASAPGALSAMTGPIDITASAFDTALPAFAAPRAVTTAAWPLFSAVGDLDQDGEADLAIACRDAAAATLLFGDGRGAYARVDLPAGLSPWDVAIGDLDGDGRPDLAVANAGANSLSLLLRDPSHPRAFVTGAVLGTGTNPSSVKAVDLDRDGRTDLVVADRGSNDVRVFLQHPTLAGTFRAPVSYAVGAQPYYVAAGDVDGDGRLDLVVPNAESGTVSLLFASAATAGAFLPAVNLGAGSFPAHAAIADLNADGRPDLVVTNAALSGGVSSVGVLLQDPLLPGTFLAPVNLVAGTNPLGAAVGDVDGDGRVDLVVANQNSHGLSLFFQSAANPGVFLPEVRVVSPMRPILPHLLDVDHDGRLDVVVPHSRSSDVHVFLRDAAEPRKLVAAPQYAVATQTRVVVAADIDRDGLLDLVASNQGSNTVSILRQDPTAPGRYLAATSLATGSRPSMLAVADLNLDGRPDIAVPNVNAGTVGIYLQSATPGAFLAPTTIATGSNLHSATVADLDGDGRPDLAVTLGGGGVKLLLQSPLAPGTFVPGATLASGVQPQQAAAADLDGDGRVDLVVCGANASGLEVFLQSRASAGAFLAPVSYATAGVTHSVEAVDLDGDGLLDVLTSNRDGGSVSIRRGVGGGALGARLDVPVGPAQVWSARAADVNGDDAPDIVVGRQGNADDPGAVCLVLQDPASRGTFVRGPSFYSGFGPTWVEPADLDRDGAVDIAAGNWNDASISVLLQRPQRFRTPGAASLAFLTQPSDVTARSVIAPAVEVAVRDAGGAMIVSATTRVTLSLESNPGGATLSRDVSAVAQGGIARFPGLSLDVAAAGYTLRARADGTPTATSAAFEVTPYLLLEPPGGVTATATAPREVTLTWTDASAIETGYRIERRLRLVPLPGGVAVHRNTGNDNCYAFIPGDLEANVARGAAAAYSVLGHAGHLATVTSSAENAFLVSMGAGWGWLGGMSASFNNTWLWDVGPEAGRTFWVNGAVGQTGYSNWAPNEPNNLNTENYLHMYMPNGLWNNARVNHLDFVEGYYVEFETAGTVGLDFAMVGTVGAGITSFVDGTVEPNTAYDYRVVALGAAGLSISSAIVPVTTPLVPATSLDFATQPVNPVDAVDLGLEGWWPLDEGTGVTTSDASGSGRTGALVGSAVWTAGMPGFGSALRFDGSTSYVTTGSNPALLVTDSFTWSFWTNLDAVQSNPNAVIVGNRAGGSFVKFTPAGFEYRPSDAGGSMSYTVPRSRWVHLCVTKTGASFKYYADGVVVASASATSNLPSIAFHIGGDSFFTEITKGLVDEVRLYDRALSAVEVAALADPAGAPSGIWALPEIRVELRDAGGVPVRGDARPVTISIAAGASGAVLGGTTTRNAVDGVARFHDLTVSPSGLGLRLVASAPGLPTAVSDPFDLVGPTAPTAPAALTAAPSGAASIALAWTDASHDESSFRIERRAGSAGAFATIGTASTNATSFVDAAPAPSTAYEYRVFAVNRGGESAPSNVAGAVSPGYTSIVDGFAGPGLAPGLEDPDAAFVIAGDARRKTSSNRDDRHFIRTVATDFNRRDWVFEVTATLGGGLDNVFVGFGIAVPDPAVGPGAPLGSLYVTLHEPNLVGGRMDVGYPRPGLQDVWFNGTSMDGVLNATAGAHRIRVEKVGTRITFSVDLNRSGAFVAESKVDLDDWRAYAPFLDDTNSRLFFGNGTSGIVWDDLSIVFTDEVLDVDGLSPSSGPDAGGTPVSIAGAGFRRSGDPLSVSFGGRAATGVTATSDALLECIAPAGVTGFADVVVTLGSARGALADGFRYVAAAPFVEPRAGPLSGGTPVLIVGTQFTPVGTTVVRVGGVAATQVVVHSATSLSCVTPPRFVTGTAVLEVVRPDASVLAIPGGFTYAGNRNAPVGGGFTDVGASAGMEALRGGVGAQWADVDGDGRIDLFVGNGYGPNDVAPADDRLYVNRGDGTFLQRAKAFDLHETDLSNARGVGLADFDGDGRPDLYVGRTTTTVLGRALAPDTLYRNAGGGAFQHVGPVVGVAADDSRNEGGVCWRDYDRDGRLDLFVPNDAGQQDFLYRNIGGRFTRVDTLVGMTDAKSSMGAAWGDYDGDGWPDLYVATNDNQAPLLYRNLAGVSFTSVAAAVGVTGTSTHSSGAAWADYDRDGDLDLFVANIGTASFLYRNDGGAFTRVEAAVGLGGVANARSCAWADYDADGDLDLAVSGDTGQIWLFRNDGGTFTRVDASAGLTNPGDAMGLCWADYDDDGALDLFVPLFSGQRNRLYRGQGAGNNWIAVRCVTDADGEAVDPFTTDDREAYGATVEVDRDATADWDYGQGTVTLQVVDGVSGRFSGNTPWLHFGLGGAAQAHVRVTFVDGTVVTYTGLGANQRVTVRDR